MTDIDEVFRLRDACLAAHPEIARMLKLVAWHEWVERQMRPVRIIEQRWRDGHLLSERDVTPLDPAPPLE